MNDTLTVRASVVLAAVWMQFREIRSSQPALLLGVVQPVVLTVLLVRAPAAGSATTAIAPTRVAIGVLLMALWSATIWTAGGVLQRERWQGTLAATVSGPHPPYLVLLGKSLSALVATVSVSLATVAVTLYALRVPVIVHRPGWVAVGGVFTLLSGTALGMLLSCVFIMTRHGAQLSAALMYPVFILSGMLVPTADLPPWLRPLTEVISLAWAQRFLGAAAAGRVDLTALAALVSLTALYFVVAIRVFGRVIDGARAEGTLVLC